MYGVAKVVWSVRHRGVKTYEYLRRRTLLALGIDLASSKRCGIKESGLCLAKS